MKKYIVPNAEITFVFTQDIITESIPFFTPTDEEGGAVYVGLDEFDLK